MAKTDKNMLDDQALDAFFEAAQSTSIKPSDALMSAILSDASELQPSPDQIGQTDQTAQPKRRYWRDFIGALGGWPALAGMATATVAGVWIGFAAPTQLETMSGGLVLSGDYAFLDETYVLEDMTPSYLGTSFLMEDDG